MKKNKLITLLKIFSEKEMKEFEKFISSPYFNEGRNFKPFYKILKQHYPDFDSTDLTEENLFKKLYPDKSFDKKSSVTMRVLLSKMTAMAEKFLIHDSIKSDTLIFPYQALTWVLYNNNENEYALDVALKGKQLLDRELNQTNIYDARIVLYNLIHSIYLNSDDQIRSCDYYELSLLYMFGFLFEILPREATAFLSMKQRYNIDLKGTKLIKQFVDSFDPVLFSKDCTNDEFDTKNTTLMSYYIVKALLNSEDDESLNYAIKFFFNNFQKFVQNTRFSFFSQLHITCAARAAEIDFEKYGMLAHKLSEFAWERGINKAEEHGFIRFIVYVSIFDFKIAFLQPEELQEFADKYVNKVNPESRENAEIYSSAFIHYRKREFDKSLEFISRLSIVDISTKENIHKLKIVCLYELAYIEEALSAIDSFEHYLKNNKNVYEESKKNGKKFSNAMKIMIKIKSWVWSGSEMELKTAVNENKNSLFGRWFKEKMEEIASKQNKTVIIRSVIIFFIFSLKLREFMIENLFLETMWL